MGDCMFNPGLPIQKYMPFLTWQLVMVPESKVTVYWIVTFYKMYLIGISLFSQDIGFRKREDEGRMVKGKERALQRRQQRSHLMLIYCKLKVTTFLYSTPPWKIVSITAKKQKTIIVPPHPIPMEISFQNTDLWCSTLPKTEQRQNVKLIQCRKVSVCEYQLMRTNGKLSHGWKLVGSSNHLSW